MDYQPPWWDAPDRATAVGAVCEKLAKDQAWRRLQTLKRLSVYYGRPIRNFAVARDMRPTVGQDGEVEFPFAMSVIQTAQAKIAAKQKPKPVVLTKGAQYRTRLQARKLSKFLEGQFWQRQGVFPTLWALTRQQFFDGEVFEAGVGRVRANVEMERVDIDRVFAHEIYFDPQDAESGHPTSLYHRYSYDRYQLVGMFPKLKTQIMAAPAYREPDELQGVGDPHRVLIYEAYRLRFNEKMPGRHVLAIAGDGKTIKLADEEYARDTFPYVFFLWERQPFGAWGNPITDQVELPQALANKMFDRINENITLGAGGYVAVAKNSVASDAAIYSNASLKVIEYAQGSQPPTITMPAPFNPLVLNVAEMFRGFVFQFPGVNEMMAQGRKEAGIDSGVALRDMNDLQGERFLPKSQDYEQLHVEYGKRILEAVEDLAAAGVSPKSWLPSNGLVDEIEWQKIAYDCVDKYEVTIQAASAIADSLPARKQFISDMQAAGLIDPEVAKRMLASSDPDLEAWSNRDSAQWNWIERIISEIHDVEDDEETIVVDPPDPLMNYLSAAMQMTEAYLEISSWPGTPENKRNCMRNWIVMCMAEINKAKAGAPPPPAPAGPAMPPGPPPQPMM